MSVEHLAERFRALHRPGSPLLLPNAWDAGSAKILETLGFAAIATTSSGFAGTLGRRDGNISREEALANAADLVRAVGVPVSADLENGYTDEPRDVAEVVGAAREVGLAGCSIEDYTRRDDDSIYDAGLARERIEAAADAAGSLVLTARCENYLHGRPNLRETLNRLQVYQEAGADVLYAPGLREIDDIRALCAETDRPINVLLVQGGPTPAELADAGVARISVGGAFARTALTGLIEAARELLDGGTAFLDHAVRARPIIDRAFD